MSNNRMFYREVAPRAEIAHLVLSFWEFVGESENPEPIHHEVFPDGCVSLIYHRNENTPVALLLIKDLTLETAKTQIYAGDVYWGIRFAPAAGAKILRADPSEIYSHPLFLEAKELPHLTGGLLENLNACRSFEQAIIVYQTLVESLALPASEIDAKVAEVVRIIEENPGETKIADAAKKVNLSVRQLERRFKRNVGLSPKQYARARRIRATAINMLEESKLNWASRALEMGFTDQSHLTHEFSNLTGRSPNAFAERVKRIEHGELVK